jgi:hypothetical protein
VLAAIGLSSSLWSSRRLPSEQLARQYFASHKADFVHFVSALHQTPDVRFVSPYGVARNRNGGSQYVFEYLYLMQRLNAKSAIIREDGSVEVALWGSGCTICSDSYMGVRYLPAQHDANARPGWRAQIVQSLSAESLPRQNAGIADGLYVVQLEPEWSIYRFEYQE